ncbi:MAG: hypothetical protein JXB30_04850 [Anaerolineae bacterium]|nr:hypothetical protein [Anaerolineae bacterium]
MSIYIWQGFDHYWQREPHRLNKCGSYIDADVTGEHPLVHFVSMMQIGRFPPDTCHTHSVVHHAGNVSSRSIDGSSTLQVRGSLGEYVSAQGDRVTIDLPDDHLCATVVLRGFELESSFPHGFHTRGFGFQIQDIRQDTTAISFTPCCCIFPDRSPDPTTNPDCFVWKIIPFPPVLKPRTPNQFEYSMTLYYSVIFDQESKIGFSYDNVSSGPIRSRHIGPGAGRTITPCAFQGEPGNKYAGATVGIRGFKWELLPWDRTRYDGRYLRKIQFIFDGLDYDLATGRMTCVPKMEFNNFGGQHGREQVSRLIRLLRSRRRSSKGFLRAVARSIRGIYGFNVRYEMNTTMLQFVDENSTPPSYLYNRIRKDPVSITLV